MLPVSINSLARTRPGRVERTVAGQIAHRMQSSLRKPRISRAASLRASLHHAKKSWREDPREAEASGAVLWKNLVQCPTITSRNGVLRLPWSDVIVGLA